MATMLKFATLISDIELSFYTSLASHKINHDKLDDSARRLLGLYEVRPSDSPESSCRLQIHGNALTNDTVPAGFCRAEGMIKNVNTIEEYKNLDKGAILSQSARTIWDAILDGTIFSCPSLLASFTVICFADIKKYKFTYQFAFPVIHPESPWNLRSVPSTASDANDVWGGSENAAIHLSSLETTSLVDCVQTWRYGVDARQFGFFLAKRKRDSKPGERRRDSKSGDSIADPDLRPTTPGTPSHDMGFMWAVSSLSDFESFFTKVAAEDQYVCFVDPSTYPSYPGWMLRNLLLMIRIRWKLEQVQILCYRDTQARRDDARTIVLRLETKYPNPAAPINIGQSQMLKVTGWERNGSGKVTSKVANLGEYMDPQRLADQAVDLNLKLIKWRIAPSLDLDKVKNTSCLLLGAGTLGGYVARILLGWGVKKITFVDNGFVSFSNPVRQPLFEFKDCLNGGAPKAIQAAAALTKIYPGVNSRGYAISVAMAGHPIIDEAAAKSNFETLEKLIEEHEAIFLLMDTRESRWLPTVMGKAAGKIVMNAALGFDTFLVMRHGLHNPKHLTEELGCYFCNDVVAPADSITDRTLDQQCTVTRPGIAAIASALLVEIFISVLQHPQGALAPAPFSASGDRETHPLGLVPHQIRGFLSNFQNMMISGKSYDCCSACSEKITNAYKAEGWHFVKRALNEKGYVEDLSGLAEIQRIAENAISEVDWSEGDSVVDGSDGELM